MENLRNSNGNNHNHTSPNEDIWKNWEKIKVQTTEEDEIIFYLDALINRENQKLFDGLAFLLKIKGVPLPIRAKFINGVWQLPDLSVEHYSYLLPSTGPYPFNKTERTEIEKLSEDLALIIELMIDSV